MFAQWIMYTFQTTICRVPCKAFSGFTGTSGPRAQRHIAAKALFRVNGFRFSSRSHSPTAEHYLGKVNTRKMDMFSQIGTGAFPLSGTLVLWPK